MKLSEKQAIFSKNVSFLIQFIFSQGYSCSLGEVFRTPEQAALYAKEGKGIKDSLHCKRLAIDINLFSPSGQYLSKSDDYAEFGEYWETLHTSNRWGGVFSKPDGNHFEMQDI